MEVEASRHWHQYIPELPPPYLHTVSGSEVFTVGRPGTEVAMALSSLSLPPQIELHCTSPHVPSIALRDMNLTTVSSPTTIHPHIPIIAGATSSGRVLLWDWESSCRKALKTFCFWTFILTTRKRIIILDKVSGWSVVYASVSWSHWRINFMLNYFMCCFVLSWSWLNYLKKGIYQSTV